MNKKNAVPIQFKPSQLLNLPAFLLGVLLVPSILLLDGVIKLYLPSGFVKAPFDSHILKLPFYLSLLYASYLGYHILKVYCTRYEIGSEEFRYCSGILHRKHEFIENYRVKDFRIDRPSVYRIFGLGTLTIYTSAKTSPVFKMEAIRNPQDIYKTLRGLVEQNRREKHVFKVD
jgi:uncharacterized membrane protein YdbT with pleckstrin-like domain